MENDDLEWYEIPGYNGKYLITKCGKVKRPYWPSTKTRGKTLVGGNQLKPGKYGNGYLYYHLRREGKHEVRMVHRLIAITFIPNHDNKPQVNHKNGIKTDNSIDNLEWCTISENSRHAFDTGLWRPRKGVMCTGAKLTEDQVREIRALKVMPVSTRPTLITTARKYGVGQTIIHDIISGRKWKHII